ncbi:MAG: DUF5753 domain-containing protein [Egibacteraceae bacterium]
MSAPEGFEDDAVRARRRLAKRLRDLRLLARLSGEQLGTLCGWAQTKTSRIETGVTVPQIADIGAWLRAVDAAPEVQDELLDLADAALTSASSWQHQHRHGLGRNQQRIAGLEAAASVIRSFQVDIIPGILQTAAYARAVMSFGNPSGQVDLAEAVKARMDRQAILFDTSKRFELLIWEPALRWQPGPPELLLGQLDRVLSLLDLPNVEVGIIPLDKPASTLLYHGFVILGEPSVDDDVYVLVETIADELRISAADKVGLYLERFDRLREAAVFGDDARPVLHRITKELIP